MNIRQRLLISYLGFLFGGYIIFALAFGPLATATYFLLSSGSFLINAAMVKENP